LFKFCKISSDQSLDLCNGEDIIIDLEDKFFDIDARSLRSFFYSIKKSINLSSSLVSFEGRALLSFARIWTVRSLATLSFMENLASLLAVISGSLNP
jgi:hypothetical protein